LKSTPLDEKARLGSFKGLPTLVNSALGILPYERHARKPYGLVEAGVCNKESEDAPFTQLVLHKPLDIKA